MHRPTIEVYEDSAGTYAERRGVQRPERVDAFAAAVEEVVDGDQRRLDLGCGPGHYLERLGRPAVAVDAAMNMVREARRRAPDVPAVRADVAALPFRRASFTGIWASKTHQHIEAVDLPMALADAHACLRPGGRLDLTMWAGEGAGLSEAPDDLPGRWFTFWSPDALGHILTGAGFGHDGVAVVGEGDHPRLEVTATRERSLPDFVGPDLRLLCCGLNPSLHAADAGVGYVTPGNRFWPTLRDAGLTTFDRDPRRLLRHDRIGMTDIVKRATARAADLSTAEFRAGLERLEHMCAWLQPDAVVMVGLAGWRAAANRRAGPGWQPEGLGGVPVYVMPSTSGLNAVTSRAELAAHFSTAAAGP